MIVIIESPFAATPEISREEHIEYARRCLKDSLERGESPFASHLLYTQVLDDTNKDERKRGIEAGLKFYDAAERCIVYQDYKISRGMMMGIVAAETFGVPVEYREIGKNE